MCMCLTDCVQFLCHESGKFSVILDFSPSFDNCVQGILRHFMHNLRVLGMDVKVRLLVDGHSTALVGTSHHLSKGLKTVLHLEESV